MFYWTPKRLKELKRAGYKLQAAPAMFIKPQADNHKQTTSNKQQAKPEPSSGSQTSSDKHQLQHNKRQA